MLCAQGILVLSVVGAVLWLCMPKKDGTPSVSAAIAPYIAVAITLGSVVGLGAMFLGLIRLVSNAYSSNGRSCQTWSMPNDRATV